MRDIRLGDDIDDYCVRCKRVMNHAVVSVINAAPAKVRCRICHSDHDYRHEQAPPPKVDLRKAGLFNEVLKKVKPGIAVTPADAPADEEIESVPADIASVDVEAIENETIEDEVLEIAAVEAEAEPVEPEPEPVAEPEPVRSKPARKVTAKAMQAVKTKPKARAKARK